MGPKDAALEEFRALRGEQLSHMSAQGAILGLALTAIAALSALAVGVKSGAGRPEYLLILPIVLNGLGLAYMGHTDVMRTIGRYIESELWPFVTTPEPGEELPPAPSWETFIRTTNPPFIARWNVKVMWLLNSIPGGMIFGLPTVAALLINAELAIDWDHENLAIAWWLGLLASLATLWITVLAGLRNTAEDRRLEPARAARLRTPADPDAVRPRAELPDG